ncbi:hypothetical protein DRO64_00220, partial [Candidatus Bathyarchaeota archaeon]
MRINKILVVVGISGILLLSTFLITLMHKPIKAIYHLDVIDLREKDYKTRLIILSLQGIVNRKEPKLYVLWESRDKFGNPSEEWLKYCESKGWISYEEISIESALKKYKDEIEGFVVYDPNFRHTINVATTMSGL